MNVSGFRGNQKLWIGEILKERDRVTERQEMCVCRDLEGLGYGYDGGIGFSYGWYTQNS